MPLNRADALAFVREFLAPYADPDGWDLDAIVTSAFTVTTAGSLRLDVDQTQLLHIASRNVIPGPPSSVDCPAWCVLTHGHRYDEDVDGSLVRWHEASGTKSGRITVDVIQEETAVGPAGPVSYRPIAASLYADGDCAGEPLTASDCHAAARALLNAASVLERIVNAEHT